MPQRSPVVLVGDECFGDGPDTGTPMDDADDPVPCHSTDEIETRTPKLGSGDACRPVNRNPAAPDDAGSRQDIGGVDAAARGG